MDEDSIRNLATPNRARNGRNGSTSRAGQFNLDSSEDTSPSRFRGREEVIPDNYNMQYVDLSDLPSDRPVSPSASLNSLESYSSSLFHLSEHRNSIISSIPSITSPNSEDPPYRESGATSPSSVDGVDYSGGPPLQTSLPETAALARLTCQQVDEMMSLVLTMIRRLDQLDERVSSLVPEEVPDRPRSPPPPPNSKEFTPSAWIKGAFFIALPVFVVATVNYLRTGSVRQTRRR